MELTKTQRALLRLMVFREAPPGGPCWIAREVRGRWALHVFTMMGRYEFHSYVAGRTLRALHSAGLIEYGPDVKMPSWHRPRTLHEATDGCTATITLSGRAAVGDA